LASRSSFPKPVITMDEGGVIRSASDSVEQVFGWTPTEMFGRNVKILIAEPRRSFLDRFLDRQRNADTAKSLTRIRRFDAVRKGGSLFQIDIGADSADERVRLHELIMEQTLAFATALLRLQVEYLESLSAGLHALTLDPDGTADADGGAGPITPSWLGPHASVKPTNRATRRRAPIGTISRTMTGNDLGGRSRVQAVVQGGAGMRLPNG
jgi:PAS domain S-box-containing protein